MPSLPCSAGKMPFDATMVAAGWWYPFELEVWTVAGISHSWWKMSENHTMASALIPQPQQNFGRKGFAFIQSYRNVQFHNCTMCIGDIKITS